MKANPPHTSVGARVGSTIAASVGWDVGEAVGELVGQTPHSPIFNSSAS